MKPTVLIFIALFAASCATPPILIEATDFKLDELQDPFEQETCCRYWHPVYGYEVTCVTTDGSCEYCDSLCKAYPLP